MQRTRKSSICAFHVVVFQKISELKELAEMTFDLVLSSLLYHGREWFVFQDILTHLPQEKAAAATQRSKTTQKYTYRFGITRDWVTGDGRKVLVDRHFIDSNDPGRSLIFSSVLIDAERVEELFLESFNKRFRLKVQQFHLTATALDSAWFEWHFDPKQKDGCAVKKTKLTVEQSNHHEASRAQEKTPQNNQYSDSENMTPNLSSNENRQTPQASKRRRPVLENGDQLNNDYSPSISESVLMRPRKKAKEANLSISKYLDQQEDEKPDTMEQKEEPMSPDYKPDMANFHSIKRSLSPMEKPKIKLSPSSSPQTIIKEDVMLSSVRDSNADSDTDYISPSNDTSQESNTTQQENNANSQKSDNLNESEITDLPNDASQDSMALNDDQDMPDVGNIPDDEDVSGDKGSVPDNGGDVQQNAGNVSDNNSTVDYNNSADNSGSDDGNVPDSNIPDDANLSSQTEPPTSPSSSLLDNSSNILENIKLQKQELCTEEEDAVLVEGQSSEVPSTSSDTSMPAETHKHDCGAEACSSNGASSTVCLCTTEEKSKQETAAEKVRSTEASELLDGLKAAGFVPLVRQLLENVQGDTRLSQMEGELNTLGNQINQKRKANRQLQKSIKRKAGELEKLFDNLRKGKAHCEMLEQKHKALQVEKATVEAKVKKCLEVLNSVD